MFTQPNLRTIAATTLAGLIGTAGVVAAAASGGSDTAPATQNTPAITAPISTAPNDEAPTTSEAASEPTGETDSHPTGFSETGPGDTIPSTPADTSPTDAAAEEPAPGDDDVEEHEAPGEPTVVDGEDDPQDPPPPPPPPGGPTELVPVPKPVPPLPPIPGPVDLVTPPMDPGPAPIDDFVAPIDPTPFDIATGFQVTPLPGYLGELSSGLSGCQLECVQTAILTSNDVNSSVHLAAATTVPVHFEVEVTKTGTDSSTFFNNPGYDTAWETTLQPLQPDTTYDLTLIAIDQDGHSKVYEHQFTTVDIIDGLAGNAQGCALQCITTGVVNKTQHADMVQVHVKTNTPAALQVWMSTNEPTWVDDPAAKPADDPVYATENTATSWTFDVPGLEPETLYHIVARAEDDHGVAYQVGTFTTDAEQFANVLVTFEQVDVTHDGDQHQWNRGEIQFAWGFDGSSLGRRSEQKMHAGSFSLNSHNAKWFTVDAHDGVIPDPVMHASERDADLLTEFCAVGQGVASEPVYIADCDAKINVAKMNRPIGIGEIADFPLCAEWGVEGPTADARCTAIGTATFGTRDDDYAHFTAIVSFVVED